MIFRILLSALFFLSSPAFGKELGIDDILALSKKPSDQRRIIDQSKKLTDATIGVYRASALPRLDAEISALRSASPTEYLFNSNNFGGSGQGGSGESGDQTGPDPSNLPERFYSTQYGVNLNLASPLYTFGRFGSVWRISNNMKSKNNLEYNQNIEKHYMAALELYTKALQALNLERIAVRNEKLFRNILEFTRLEYSSGARSKMEYLRSVASHDVAQADLLKSKLDAENTRQRLQDYLDVADMKDFRLRAGTEQSTKLFRGIKGLKSQNNLDLRIAEQDYSIAKDTLHYYKAGYFPSINLVGSVSSSITKPNFYSSKEYDFNDAFDQNTQTYALGVVLNWNLFDGLKTKNEIRKAAAEKAIAQNKLNQIRKDRRIVVKEVRNNYSVTTLLYEANKKAVDASKIALDAAESDYKNGSLSLNELLEIQKQFTENEKNKIEAYSSKIMSAAKLRYELGHTIAQ